MWIKLNSEDILSQLKLQGRKPRTRRPHPLRPDWARYRRGIQDEVLNHISTLEIGVNFIARDCRDWILGRRPALEPDIRAVSMALIRISQDPDSLICVVGRATKGKATIYERRY